MDSVHSSKRISNLYPSSPGSAARTESSLENSEKTLAQVTAESEKWRRLYETVLSNTPDLIYVFDLNHRFTYANNALLKMWGKTWDEAIGKNCLELGYEPWHAAMHDREIEQVVATKQPIRGEVPFTGTNGRRIYDYIFVPVLGPNGEVEAIAGTTRDVTERKHGEEKLRASEERFRTFTSVTSDVVYRMSPDWAEMRHLQGKAFIADTTDPSRTWLDKYIYPDDQAQVMAAIRKAIRTESIFQLEHRVIRVDGTLGWTSSRAIPIRDANGEIVEWFGAAADITEQKRAEEEVRRLNAELEQRVHQRTQQLRHANRQLAERAEQVEIQAGLLNLSPVAVFIRDWDGTIRYWNEGATEVYGWSAKEALGRRTHELLQTVFPIALDELRSELLRTGRWEGELQHRTSSGQQIIVASRWRVSDTKQNQESLLEVNVDITARKKAEQLAQQHLDELARSNAELERFAYVASHDLQEPLRMVSNYTGMLAEEYGERLDDRANGFMHYITDGAARMQQLIEDLLRLSRATSDSNPFKPVDLNLALQAAVENLSFAIEESGTVINQAEMPTVSGNRVQLTQVFQNLIGNAIKFRGSEPPHIDLTAEHRNGEWFFSIRDNGIGIPAKDLESIFRGFHRVHSRIKYPGSGIGLALCRRIIERHGGRIWAESEPGRGTAFFFTLPADTS